MSNTRLNIPEINFDEMFKSCTENVKTTEERNRIRLEGYLDILQRNNKTYVSNMQETKRFSECFPYKKDSMEYSTFKKDMNWLYEKKFSNKLHNERKYYDLINKNVKNKRCPYCLHSDIDEIDHYLPKSKYPSLALTTENLVPACHKCNNKKLEKIRLFPHPYFDNVDMYTFIQCKINFTNTTCDLILDYEIDESAVPSTLYIKIKNFVDITERLHDYSVHAASEFNIKKRSLIRNLKSGKESLIDEIQDALIGHELELGKNCWQAAFYRSLLKNIDKLIKYLEVIQMEENILK
ncbi:hypothetical protein JEOAER750_01068 [Jeotgalicoccus aerolatus]|uniref:5-methylcytosine-specific restriction endonuclease McrA n=1 Tax=Jeotgalicoccus aerolatus TaxID=709510 RepID=A0ABS4HLT0_9STAP|nr:HNH endonuclease [Jeotgalicoccus aerolatus]MBP1951873.1 5-methylcytosine-specific restriction endonuclease McrA [Jeotgalicoccus aerolatus]GGD94065.1 HNH endonuclease [Jeotgalicoccus aerolatus]CAD2074936.1 hypothetical protein JEOAER750_01068 [Jeotgalicoccus aerolatus]